MRIDLRLAILLAMFLIGACSPAPSQGELATAVAQLAAEATLTSAALPTPAAASATPSATVGITATRTIALVGPHPDGVYLVGVDIAAGVWRAIPPAPQLQRDRFCYWARRKYDGIVLGSHYGPEASEILIRPQDFEVEFDGCGVWVYMGER